jgi:RNA polymerase sigma-70 factor (subfamily 1)
MSEESIEPGLLSLLIPRMRDGDEAAREQLLIQLQDYLTRTADRQLEGALKQKTAVSDIVQISLIRIIESFEQFRGSSSNELRAWIKQIVVNEANTVRRKYRTNKRDVTLEKSIDAAAGANAAQPADKHLTPASAAMRGERLDRFHAVLDELPADQARVIRLRSIERLSFREVGEQMDRSEEAVSQLWYRAIMKLEEALNRHGDLG